jgi:hypothetical protein
MFRRIRSRLTRIRPPSFRALFWVNTETVYSARRQADLVMAIGYWDVPIIRGRPFGVGFECSAQPIQKGAPL